MNKTYLMGIAILALRYGQVALREALDKFPIDELPTIEALENAILNA